MSVTTRIVPATQPAPDPKSPQTSPLSFDKLVASRRKDWAGQPNEQHFVQRLDLAIEDSRLKDNKEHTEAALGVLLECGLIVKDDLTGNDLGTFILRHLFGAGSQYDLQVSFDTVDSTTKQTTNHTINCPIKSRMTLSHLAEELQARIILFSNRAQPRVYSSTDPQHTCAFFHHVDSFFGSSEYLALTFANHKTRRVLSKASTTPTAVASSHQQPAVLRKIKRVINYHLKIDLDNEKSATLRKALEEASRKLIHENTKKKVEKAVKSKKRKKPGGETVEEARQALKDEIAEPTRVPYGLVSNASNIYRGWKPADMTPTSRLRREMAEAVAIEGKDNDSSIIALWTSVVSSEYDEIWNHEYEQCTTPQQSSQGSSSDVQQSSQDTSEVQHQQGTEGGSQSHASEKGGGEGDPPDDDGDDDDDAHGKESKNMRCCTATLKQILHPDLVNDPESLSRILELLEQQQEAATDVEAQMYILAHKATLMIASGALWSEDPEPFDLTGLLPEWFQMEEDSRLVQVAPLPDGQQAQIEEAVTNNRKDELVNLLSQNHLSAMFTHFSPTSSTTEASSSSSSPPRPRIESMSTATTSIWQQLSHLIASSSECAPVRGREGMTHTINAHLRQCATMLENLWQGNIYSKSLDYLLRFLLRTWLAPEREQSNKDRAMKYAESKKTVKEERDAKKSNRLAPSHWRHSMRRLLDQLADCEGKLGRNWGEADPQSSAVHRHAALLSDLLKLDTKRPKQGIWNPQPLLPLELSLAPIEQEADEDDEDDDWQADMEFLLDQELEQGAQLAMDAQAIPQQSAHTSMDLSAATALLHPSPSTSTAPVSSANKPKEPSRKQLKRLQALLRILLESPSRVRQYTTEQVREAAFKDHDFTDAQLDVVKILANQLRPFMPRRWRTEDGDGYRAHTPHVVLRSPIVILANTVLRVTGHLDFARRIAPHVATGDIHSLQLGPMQLFETLCSSAENHFDISDINGNPLTNVANITSPKENKGAVFGAFFDTSKINQICRAHGICFGNRLMYSDMYTVHMVGKQVSTKDDPKRHPVVSEYELRRKNSTEENTHDGRWRREWLRLQQEGLTRSDLEERLSEAGQRVQDLKKTIVAPRKETASLRTRATIALQAFKSNKDQLQRDRLFTEMKAAQARSRDAGEHLAGMQQRLTKANKALYFWRKVAVAAKGASKAKAKTPTMSSPSWDRPAAEDSPQYLDISSLLSQHGTIVNGRQRLVGFWTEDPGVRVMSENGFRSLQDIRASINRFELLRDLKQGEDETGMDVDLPECDQDVSMSSPAKDPDKIAATHAKAKELKIPKTTRVTAKQIDEISFTRKLMKVRERALSHDEEAKQALESISKKDVALSSATSIEQVDAATKARRDATDPIRKFNKTPSLMKLRRTQRHRTKRAWAKVASDIRDRATQNAVESAPTPETPPPKTDPKTGYCEDCGEYESEKVSSGKFHHPETCIKQKPEVRLIGCIGDAGTGFGSRIGGHSRRGGGKLRHEHRQNATVAMTDEHLTSKTCPFCFERTRPAKGRRLVGDKIKTVSINGAMECTNRHCESFQAGYTIKPRDGQASHNMGTTGGFVLLSPNKEAMPPFSPYERQPLAGNITRIQHLDDDAMDAPLGDIVQ